MKTVRGNGVAPKPAMIGRFASIKGQPLTTSGRCRQGAWSAEKDPAIERRRPARTDSRRRATRAPHSGLRPPLSTTWREARMKTVLGNGKWFRSQRALRAGRPRSIHTVLGAGGFAGSNCELPTTNCKLPHPAFGASSQNSRRSFDVRTRLPPSRLARYIAWSATFTRVG